VNNDYLTDSIINLVKQIGWEVRRVYHPSSLRLDLTVTPPLTAIVKGIQVMMYQLYNLPFFGSTIGNCFTMHHDLGKSYIAFKQAAKLPDFPWLQMEERHDRTLPDSLQSEE